MWHRLLSCQFWAVQNLLQGAYKFGKVKFPEFSRFPRPFKQSFPYNYNVKSRCNEPPYQPFRYLSCSNAKLQNIFLRSMVTSSTHASHCVCVTQPIYATVTKNYYAYKSMPKKHSQVAFENFQSIGLFQISLSFPESKNPSVFQVFQSCKHPVLFST